MHIGFDHIVPWWEVEAILAPTGSPQRKLRQKAKEDGRLLDCTAGRPTRSIIVTKNNRVILSGILSETLQPRLAAARQRDLASSPGGELR